MSQIREVFDVAYHPEESVREKWGRQVALDLYLPVEMGKKPPVFIFIHGGAWIHRDMDGFRHVGRGFAERNIACVCINYRLSLGDNPVVNPTHTNDCAAACAWVFEHADEYGYDAANVFLGGHSAGAHMTGMIALNPDFLGPYDATCWSKLKGFIGLSGIYDIDVMVQDYPSYAEMSVEKAFPGDAQYWKQSSPVSHEKANGASWLIFHSPEDELLTEKQSHLFIDHLKKLNVSVGYSNNFKDKHFEILENAAMFNEAAEFIQKHAL